MPDYQNIFRGMEPAPQAVDWTAVEARLGISLPADYREYADHYPAMKIDSFINIPHPHSPNSAANLVGWSAWAVERWSALEVQAEGDFPHPIFPAAGGLFPWGYDDEDGHYFWKTGGDPSTWTIVVVESLEWWEHPGGFGDFLRGYTAGEIISPVLEEGISGPDYPVRPMSE